MTETFPITPKHLLTIAIPRLQAAGCDTPRLDAELLLAHICRRDRAWLYAHLTDPLPHHIPPAFETVLCRREAREPVAYIIGKRAFFGLDFYVTPAVLIPRPESELLVSLALDLLPADEPAHLADVGTGSGCLAISLAVARPQWRCTAVDIAPAALAVAARNAAWHGVTRQIRLQQSHLLNSLTEPADLILANPPYIAPSTLPHLAPEVRQYEPPHALTDFQTGLSLIETLLQTAPAHLKPPGHIIIEIGADQGQAVLNLARSYCPQARFRIDTDLAGRDRVLVGHGLALT